MFVHVEVIIDIYVTMLNLFLTFHFNNLLDISKIVLKITYQKTSHVIVLLLHASFVGSYFRTKLTIVQKQKLLSKK